MILDLKRFLKHNDQYSSLLVTVENEGLLSRANIIIRYIMTIFVYNDIDFSSVVRLPLYKGLDGCEPISGRV